VLDALVVVSPDPLAVAVEVVAGGDARGEPDVDELAVANRCEARVADVLTVGPEEARPVNLLQRVVQVFLELLVFTAPATYSAFMSFHLAARGSKALKAGLALFSASVSASR